MSIESKPEVPPKPNGKVRHDLVTGVAVALVACICAEALISLACMIWPPQDWNIVNTTANHMNTLAVMLGGGLLGLLKSGGRSE